MEAKAALASASNTVAAEYLAGRMTKEQAVLALMKYSLYSRGGAEKRVAFIETYRSYVINYNIGQDMVRDHVYRAGKTDAARCWCRRTGKPVRWQSQVRAGRKANPDLNGCCAPQ